jgi:hypothetical protein
VPTSSVSATVSYVPTSSVSATVSYVPTTSVSLATMGTQVPTYLPTSAAPTPSVSSAGTAAAGGDTIAPTPSASATGSAPSSEVAIAAAVGATVSFAAHPCHPPSTVFEGFVFSPVD